MGLQYYFYVVISLSGRVGFGITQNPAERNQQYCSHAGDIVKFAFLYSGQRSHAKALERIIKNEYVDNLWFVGDWKTEWLNKNITATVLQEYINELIVSRHIKLKVVAKDYDFTEDFTVLP